jgi:hypothetical protein
VHRQSVNRWARQLSESGISGLKKAGRAGRRKAESYYLSGKGTDLGCVLQVREEIAHSWYQYPEGKDALHPWDGVTLAQWIRAQVTHNDRQCQTPSNRRTESPRVLGSKRMAGLPKSGEKITTGFSWPRQATASCPRRWR